MIVRPFPITVRATRARHVLHSPNSRGDMAGPETQAAAQRLAVASRHLHPVPCAGRQETPTDLECAAWPKQRHSILHWNGWGYKDSGFSLDKDGLATFTGSRYELSGMVLPHL